MKRGYYHRTETHRNLAKLPGEHATKTNKIIKKEKKEEKEKKAPEQKH